MDRRCGRRNASRACSGHGVREDRRDVVRVDRLEVDRSLRSITIDRAASARPSARARSGPHGMRVAAPDRVGRALGRRGRLPNAGCTPASRPAAPVAGRGGADPGRGGRDGRHRRRRGSLVRSGVPVPLVPARVRQARPHPAAERALLPRRAWWIPGRASCRSRAARAARAGCWRTSSGESTSPRRSEAAWSPTAWTTCSGWSAAALPRDQRARGGGRALRRRGPRGRRGQRGRRLRAGVALSVHQGPGVTTR